MVLTNIAKPYTQAILANAQENNSKDTWSALLDQCAAIVANDEFASFVQSPKVDEVAQEGLLTKLVSSSLGRDVLAAEAALIRLVIKNKRLAAMPAIASLFSQLKDQEDNSQVFTVVTPYALSDEQSAQLQTSLGGGSDKVVLNNKVDESLLAGAVIQEGDKVVDASLQARLAKLTTALLK